MIDLSNYPPKAMRMNSYRVDRGFKDKFVPRLLVLTALATILNLNPPLSFSASPLGTTHTTSTHSTETQSISTINKVSPVTRIALPTLPANFINQISSIALGGNQNNPTIYLAGTSNFDTSTLVSSPGLGSSDGFVSALSADGSPLWSVRLGDVGDDEALTIIRGKYGNLWVAGLSAVPNKSASANSNSPSNSSKTGNGTNPGETNTATSSSGGNTSAQSNISNNLTQILNPDSVTVSTPLAPISIPGSDLKRLTVWMVSTRGVLLGTTYYTSSTPLVPQSITDNSSPTQTSLLISGQNLVNQKSIPFSITLFSLPGQSVGTISDFKRGAKAISINAVPPSGSIFDSSSSFNLQTTRYDFSINNSATLVYGITSFKPKHPFPVVVARNIRTRTITSANYFPGVIDSYAQLGSSELAFLYQTGQNYSVSLIKPL